MSGTEAVTLETQSQMVLSGYRRLVYVRSLLLAALIAAIAVVIVIDLVTGPAGIPIADTVSALFTREGTPRATSFIIWQVRLPICIMALLVGSALALAGAEMQTILGNPLAEPFTLGVSSAAALGAALAIVLGIAIPGIPAAWVISGNAFVFALGALLLLQLLTRLGVAGPETLILFGIALGFTASAVLSLVQFIASADALQRLVFWSMGSLAGAECRRSVSWAWSSYWLFRSRSWRRVNSLLCD